MAFLLSSTRDWARSNATVASAYRKLPVSLRACVSRMFVRRMMRQAAFPALPPAARPRVSTPAPAVARAGRGVNLFAYFRGQFGLGEAARAYATALIESGYPVSLNDIDLGLPHDFNDRALEARLGQDAPHPTNVVFVNPDYFDEALARIGPERLAGRRLIACWFWELERVPTEWLPAVRRVDEILVASRFCEDAFRAAGTTPVFRVPLPLFEAEDSGLSREAFGLAPEDYVFLASFDFHSWVERKNPMAVVEAFLRAFPDAGGRVRLLIKTSNGARHPDAFSALVRAAERDRRIMVRDGILERAHVRALQRCCDAYVSLHRAEGFGLALAESMAQGKPVIATAWSGNVDFMDEGNSCPVRFRLVDIPDGDYLHAEGQRWAEADIDHAADWMRRLYADPALGVRLGTAAARDIGRRLAPAAAADALARHLDAAGPAPAAVQAGSRA